MPKKKFEVARRGTLRTLVTAGAGAAGGQPVAAKLFGARVLRATRSADGKRYLALDVGAGVLQPGSELELVRAADAAVRAAQPDLRFSPLRGAPGAAAGETLHVKVPPTAAWDTAALGAGRTPGARVDVDDLPPGTRVDVALRLGAFGAFGYCWLLHRAKPAAPEFSTGDA